MRAMGLAGAVLLWAMTTSQASGALLTSGYETQLETWLGQGDLNFTNIFTKVVGDGQNASHFHAESDGKGATFTLVEVVAHNSVAYTSPILIGGYNPLSWSSDNAHSYSSDDAERTAFIFNLTFSELRRQKLSTDAHAYYGDHQTSNFEWYGPTFGGGHDIYIDPGLTAGYSNTLSYGEDLAWSSTNILGEISGYAIQFGRIEVYTFAPAASSPSSVPEPSSCVMAGLAGLGLLVRRRKRRMRPRV